ncbi:MAG TPA: hypothetical protein VFX54_07220 [Candidatus Binatia bacterium]|nr:hypothetical protein [Candidatus Binatia bacterium]
MKRRLGHVPIQARPHARDFPQGRFQDLHTAGSYFIMCDWRGVAPRRVNDDIQFAHWLTQEIGVGCIPPSIFYQDADKHLGK